MKNKNHERKDQEPEVIWPSWFCSAMVIDTDEESLCVTPKKVDREMHRGADRNAKTLQHRSGLERR